MGDNMIDEIKIKNLKDISLLIRKDIINLAYKAGKNGAHLGGCLSMPEILSVLYGYVLNITPQTVECENRDRFILSKGHGALALYSALSCYGFITKEQLQTFKQDGSDFWTHPKMNKKYGIEFSSGSLGQGLSIAAGTAFALKMKKNEARVYVLLGDGECNEGAVWEAAAFIAHHKLDNLTVIIDRNKLQLDAPTEDIIDMSNLSAIWKSFGFDVFEADGHSIEDLVSVFKKISSKPRAFILNTVKGKGVSFIENRPEWHTGILSEELYMLAMNELEEMI